MKRIGYMEIGQSETLREDAPALFFFFLRSSSKLQSYVLHEHKCYFKKKFITHMHAVITYVYISVWKQLFIIQILLKIWCGVHKNITKEQLDCKKSVIWIFWLAADDILKPMISVKSYVKVLWYWLSFCCMVLKIRTFFLYFLQEHFGLTPEEVTAL